MKKSTIIAVLITLALILWMGFGMFFGSPQSEKIAAQEKNEAQNNQIETSFKVEVEEQSAKDITGYIVAQGDVMPDRHVTIRAETSSQIADILIKEGSIVKKDDIIAKLAIDDRNAQLAKARAKTEEERRKYQALNNLSKQGYAAKTRVDAALAALRAAQADQAQINQELGNTNIKAPFDGIIAEQFVEIGDYLSIGADMFKIVDNTPLVITLNIPQHEIANLTLNNPAFVEMNDNVQKQGHIRFISPIADESTRTFRVEIEIENPDNLPSGTSATVRLAKPAKPAHFISPALLALDNNGATGVKTVENNNKVAFHKIEIIHATPEGLYVTGLPARATIITNGQGFVTTDETVQPVAKITEKSE